MNTETRIYKISGAEGSLDDLESTLRRQQFGVERIELADEKPVRTIGGVAVPMPTKLDYVGEGEREKRPLWWDVVKRP